MLSEDEQRKLLLALALLNHDAPYSDHGCWAEKQRLVGRARALYRDLAAHWAGANATWRHLLLVKLCEVLYHEYHSLYAHFTRDYDDIWDACTLLHRELGMVV